MDTNYLKTSLDDLFNQYNLYESAINELCAFFNVNPVNDATTDLPRIIHQIKTHDIVLKRRVLLISYTDPDGHSSITAVNRKDISFIKLAASTHTQNDDYDMFFLWLQQIKHIDKILAYHNKTFNELTITEVFKFYEEKYVKDLFCSLDAFTEIVNLLCCTSRHSNSSTKWIYV